MNGIEASRHREGRVYVVLDGHRSDDDRPHVYATEDHGRSWRSLRGNLPDDAGTTRVLREDLVNENLLYLGTEFGAWFSIDRGNTWTELGANLPTVAVHEFARHPTANEIVAATHGRSLWVFDVTTLRQLTADAPRAEAALFDPAPAIMWRPAPGRGAARTFTGENPAAGAQIFYSLGKPAEDVKLEIRSLDGKTVRALEAKGEPGLHRVVWDLRGPRPEGPRGRFRAGRRVSPGAYRVVLTAHGVEHVRDLAVAIDPDHPDPAWIAGAEADEDLEAERHLESTRRKFPWRLEQRED